jgi:hypothetical protein
MDTISKSFESTMLTEYDWIFLFSKSESQVNDINPQQLGCAVGSGVGEAVSWQISQTVMVDATASANSKTTLTESKVRVAQNRPKLSSCGHDLVGKRVGDSVGSAVGDSVGAAVGAADGVAVGDAVGNSVGESDGTGVGLSLGTGMGDSVGDKIGDSVGDPVREAVGDAVGDAVGESIGGSLGKSVGDSEGTE